jgi:tetratricopeptide (TPR) repeat protein
MTSSIRSRPERVWLPVWLAAVLAVAPLGARAAGAETPSRTEAQARVKFAEGNTAYDLAEFQKALDAYSEAYRLVSLPGFLFNIAQCHRQLGHAERAAFFYRRYLALSKTEPPNAPLVRELIAEMDAAAAPKEPPKPALRAQTEAAAERRVKQDAERRRAVPLAPKASAEVASSESLARKWWVWAGAGAVALLAGGAIYVATAPQPRPTTLGTLR